MLVSHYPQTCAVDQRVGRHYRRFRGNVRPANKENQKLGRRPRLRRGLNHGRIREVRLVQARESGSVVFSCDAGVWNPAGLSEFNGLDTQIYVQISEIMNASTGQRTIV